MMYVKNVFKTAGFMIIATLLAKGMGMWRDILIAALYGTGDQAVAFSTASRIPLLFFDITLGAAISSAFIPVFNEYLSKGDQENAYRFSNSFLNIILVVTGLLCIAGILFASQIVNLIGNGLEAEQKELAASLVVILFPSIIFTGVAYAVASILQSLGEFNIPAAISLVSNGFLVLFLLIVGDRLGIHGVAWAMLIGWGFQVLIQIPSMIKKKYPYRPVIDIHNAGIRKSARLALPILISSWVQPINTSVNIFLASALNQGQAVAALDYANKLYIIFVGVLTYAVSNLIFPSISRMAAGEDREGFNEVVTKALRAVIAVILPVMVLFLMLRVPIVRLVYERGEFGPESTALTAQALFFYSFGMLGFAMQEILNKAFYSSQNGKTPMLIAMGGILLNVGLSFLLVRVVGTGLGGLALSASIASTLIAFTLLYVIHRHWKLVQRDFIINFIKLLLCALIMAGAVYIFTQFVSFGDDIFGKLLNLAVPSTVGLLVYLLAVVVFRTEEVRDVMALVRRNKQKEEE